MPEITVDVMTLFPEIFDLNMKIGVVGRAVKSGIIEIRCHQIRDYSNNKHRKVDDYPFGGGNGMIMCAEPIFQTFEHIKKLRGITPYLIMMSPKGEIINRELLENVSEKENISILCGRYEGIDQRLIDEIVNLEVSIGNYVVSGGELPSLIFLDALLRTIPGVLSSPDCFKNESHYDGTLEYPQYTRPQIWHNKKVPGVLISGNHEKINEWKEEHKIDT